MAKGADETADKPEAKPRRTPLLELSTKVEECETVTIDGDEYEVLGFKHLSDVDEAEVIGLLARYDHLSVNLATTGDDKEAVSIARKLRAKRVQLLTTLTRIPEGVVTSLPPTEQIKLVRAVQENAGMGASDGGDDG